MMELRELKKGQRFKIVGQENCHEITFKNLDGMYSYNTLDDGGYVNLRLDTPVELVPTVKDESE